MTFSVDLKDACFQIPIHLNSIQPVLAGKVYQFKTHGFGLSAALPSPHQSVCSGVRVGSQERDATPAVSG